MVIARVREMGVRKFKPIGQAQKFLSAHAAVYSLFNWFGLNIIVILGSVRLHSGVGQWLEFDPKTFRVQES
jgi:hypothetical protein